MGEASSRPSKSGGKINTDPYPRQNLPNDPQLFMMQNNSGDRRQASNVKAIYTQVTDSPDKGRSHGTSYASQSYPRDNS